VFDDDGARWGLRPKGAGVRTVSLASAVGARGIGVLAARDGASAALTDGLQLMLDLRQSAAQLHVPRLQVGDPLLEGGHEGREGGLGLGRDHVPKRCGDRRWRNDTLNEDVFVQKVWSGDASETRSKDKALHSYPDVAAPTRRPFLPRPRLRRPVLAVAGGVHVAVRSEWLAGLPDVFGTGSRHPVVDGRDRDVEHIARRDGVSLTGPGGGPRARPR